MSETVSETRHSDRLAIFGAAVLFSTGGVAIKWLSLDGWQVAGLRGLIAAVAIWALMPGPVLLRHRAVFLAGVAQGATMLLFVMASKNTTAANTIFLQSSAPLFIPFLAGPLLGERATKRDIAAMLGIALGLSFFFVGAPTATASAPNPRFGDLLAMLSGFTWACTVVGLRYLARAGVVASGATKGALLWGNSLVALVGLSFAWPLPAVGASEWVVVLYLGVVQVALSYRLLVRAVARVPALETSLLVLFEPVLNPVWAYLLLEERPSSWALAGAAILCLVTIVRALAGSRRS